MRPTECQGGLFQRLGSYSTSHNDVWSLGVILVNLTCGRNPWKQACPSDETFRAYLANPDFLRSILPISEHTNRILKRIFSLNPAARIGLKELREEILSVRTFVMTEEELKGATKATKEAARAFAGSVVREEEPEEERGDGMEEDIEVPVSEPSPRTSRRAFLSPRLSQRELTLCYFAADPSTPTQSRPRRPLTPPTTPRRSTRTTPLAPTHSSSSASSNSSSSSHSSTESPPTRYRTPPPTTSRLPPTPISPSLRRPRAPITKRPSRHRRGSLDSSSGSSNSSLPQTPTAPGFDSTEAYRRVKIVEAEEEYVDEEMGKPEYTAYYPVFADWAEAASVQQGRLEV